MFAGTDSHTFLMCGSHRKANAGLSECDDGYRESDCVHATKNMYFPTVVELERYYLTSGREHTQMQWHGLSNRSCPGLDAYISPGFSSSPLADSNVISLQTNMQADHSDLTIEIPGGSVYCPHSATRNTVGRFLNGVSEHDVCTTAADDPSGKFVHVEQKRHVRRADFWVPAISETWPSGTTQSLPFSLADPEPHTH